MIETLLTIFPWIIAVLGPVLASFFAAKVMRDTEITSVHDPRSACDSCGHQLSAIDLIPLVSFIALRGKCRYCGAPINWKIFASELLGLILYLILAFGVAQYSVTNNPIDSLLYTVFGFILLSVLFYLAIYDAFTYTIPTWGVQASVVVAIVINILVAGARMLDMGTFNIALGRVDNLLAGIGFGLFFQGIIVLTKQRGMGVGDVIVAVIIGLALGWPSVISAFYALIISAAIMGVLVAARRGKFRGTLLPLVPFMTFGFVVAYVWGVPVYNLLFRIT